MSKYWNNPFNKICSSFLFPLFQSCLFVRAGVRRTHKALCRCRRGDATLGGFVGRAGGRINQSRQSFHCRCPSGDGSPRSHARGFRALCLCFHSLALAPACLFLPSSRVSVAGINLVICLPKVHWNSWQFACTGTILHACTFQNNLDCCFVTRVM